METRKITGVVFERDELHCVIRFEGFSELKIGDVIELDEDNHFLKKTRWKVLSDVHPNKHGILQALMEPWPKLCLMNDVEEYF